MRFGYVFRYLAGGLFFMGCWCWVLGRLDCSGCLTRIVVLSCDPKDGLGECSRRVKIAVCRHCDGVYAWWAAVAVLHVSVG